MKKHLIKFIFPVLTIGLMTSCIDDDANYTSSVKPLVAIESQSATVVNEGDTFTVTLKADQAFKEDLDFHIELISGGDNADYQIVDATGAEIGATSVGDGLGNFGYEVAIPAYTDTFTFNVKMIKDALPEGDDKFTWKLRSGRNGNGLVNGADTFSVTANNFVSPELGIILDWSTDVTYKVLRQKILATDADDEELTITEHLSDIVDFDVFTGGFEAFAFTGDSPEIVNTEKNTTSILGDGTYNVMVDYWDFTPDLDDDENDILISTFNIPFTLTLSRIGSFTTTVNVPDLYNSNSGTGANGGASTKVAATIVVSNGKYTVYDRNGDLVAAE